MGAGDPGPRSGEVKSGAARNDRFFCSQFVAFVYQFAALQSGSAAASVFPLSDTKVSPSLLASMLQGHPLFREVGYMMPNER